MLAISYPDINVMRRRSALRAWLVLALLIGLGASVEAAAVTDGTAMGNVAASLQEGEWAELDTLGLVEAISNTGGSSSTIFAYAEEGMWNPSTRELFFIGGDHNGGPERFISYSNDTNRWTIEDHPYWMPTDVNQNHSYNYQAIDVAKSKYIFDEHQYDILTASWSSITTNNLPNFGRAHYAQQYFPGMGLVAIGDDGAFLLLDGANSWTTLSPLGSLNFALGGGLHPLAEYNPVHNVLIFGGGDDSNRFYKLDAERRITPIRNAPAVFRAYDTVLTVDPVSGDMLAFQGGGAWVYDVPSDAWRTLPNAAPFYAETLYSDRPAYAVIAAPISTYGVTMFVRYTHEHSSVLLYRHSTNGGVPTVDKIAPASPREVLAQ